MATSTSYSDFLIWCKKRENLGEEDDFYVYEDAYQKAYYLLGGLESILDDLYSYLFYSAGLHYIIVTNYMSTYEDEEGNLIEYYNPLYEKYKIGNKSFITSSVSEDSSSVSAHITKSLSDGDFLMTDLIKTPYGEYVYSILEQLNVGPVLL